MPQFEINYAQGVPSVVSMPRANMNVDTGAGILADAMSNFGNRLFEIGEKQQQANNAVEFSSMKRKYDEIGSAAMTGLENVTDDKEAEKLVIQYRQDVESLRSNSPSVNQEFLIHVNDTATRWTDAFANKVEGNKIKQLNDEFEVNYSGYLEHGDYAGANELLSNMQYAGAISPVKAEERRKSFFGDALLTQSDRLINLGDSASLKRAEGILTNMPKLTEKDGKSVQFTSKQLDTMDGLKTKLLSAKNRGDSALKVQQEKEQWDLYKMSENGNLTLDMLDKSVISADEKRQIWNNYQQAQYQKSKAGVSAIEEGDPAILAEVNKIVDLRPDRITPSQIYAVKGLGTRHMTGLVDRLNKNNQDKNPIDKKYKAQLASLYEAKVFGEKIKPETSDAYMKLQGELDMFLATNPSDDQAQKYFSLLIREKVKSSKIASIYTGTHGAILGVPGFIAYQSYREIKKALSGSPDTMTNTPPKEYPDATWDTQNNMWVVVRNGRKMGVQ
jgi:hypothetical protein